MPLDPDENPREFLTILLAMGMRMFRSGSGTDAQVFEDAEKFVAEAEKRYGPMNRPKAEDEKP
jgi:hypothetical protein